MRFFEPEWARERLNQPAIYRLTAEWHLLKSKS
jgi:hypothetical protein